MRIIKKGLEKPKEIKKTCGKCKTKFAFTTDDIKPDMRDGDYVICPSCRTYINAN